VVNVTRTILGKSFKALGSIIVMIGLLIFGLIFIIAPGLLIDLGCTLIKTLE
jgi:hypothetical protein